MNEQQQLHRMHPLAIALRDATEPEREGRLESKHILAVLAACEDLNAMHKQEQEAIQSALSWAREISAKMRGEFEDRINRLTLIRNEVE